MRALLAHGLANLALSLLPCHGTDCWLSMLNHGSLRVPTAVQIVPSRCSSGALVTWEGPAGALTVALSAPDFALEVALMVGRAMLVTAPAPLRYPHRGSVRHAVFHRIVGVPWTRVCNEKWAVANGQL